MLTIDVGKGRSQGEHMTRHVVLITYGEPPTPAFGMQLKYSWRILLGLTRRVAPIPVWLLPVIAMSRARFRNRLWSREQYGSPLEAITCAQAEGLHAALALLDRDVDWRVHVAYEFRDPLLESVLNGIPPNEAVAVLPMYVADSAFTHAISREAIEHWTARSGRNRRVPVRVLPPMDEERFAELSAQHVRRVLSEHGVDGSDVALVLAAHGTLLDPPRPIDTGREATERICAGIVNRLSNNFAMVANGWLNHVYGGRWTEPPIEEALRQVVSKGYRKVVYFPYGFTADNAESELEGRIALRGCAELTAIHLPCINASRDYLSALAQDIVEDGRSVIPNAAISGHVITGAL